MRNTWTLFLYHQKNPVILTPSMSALTPPPQTMRDRLQPFVYLRTERRDTLVEQSVFERTPGSWFHNTFIKTKRPDPIAYRDDGGAGRIPVYGIPLPDAVFSRMLLGLRFPDMLPNMWKAVPPGLRVTREEWQRYLVDMSLDGYCKRPTDGDDERKAKRRKAREDAYRRACETPFRKRWKRIALALAEKITADHPHWASLKLGTTEVIAAEFVTTQVRPTLDGVYDDVIAVPGEPAIPPVSIATVLCDEGDVDDHRFFRNTLRTALLQHFTPETPLTVELYRIPIRSARKRGISINYWPSTARGRTLTQGTHDVVRISIGIDKVAAISRGVPPDMSSELRGDDGSGSGGSGNIHSCASSSSDSDDEHAVDDDDAA